jgi:hypothetical protein
LAGSYPVSGRWGVTESTEKGPVDCGKLRVISFNGDTRTDSGGGVPAYRNSSVTPRGTNEYDVIDIFTTGQISNAQAVYTLKKIDGDHIQLNMQQGGALKLRQCK